MPAANDMGAVCLGGAVNLVIELALFTLHKSLICLSTIVSWHLAMVLKS